MPSNKLKIGIIILAAGDSSRMRGVPKQLLEFGGKTLLRLTVETAIKANFFSILIVLGAGAEDFQKEICDLPVEILVNRFWAVGLSQSIKTGVSVAVEKDWDAVLIMLCDQPFVTSENLCRLRDCFIETGKPIVASKYRETFGVPALLAREFFSDLLDLSNDEGAKKIIGKYLNKTVLLDLPEAAFDVDTPSDYENLKKSES